MGRLSYHVTEAGKRGSPRRWAVMHTQGPAAHGSNYLVLLLGLVPAPSLTTTKDSSFLRSWGVRPGRLACSMALLQPGGQCRRGTIGED